MFWSNFEELCKKAGLSPNAVTASLGFGSSAVTHWKKGTVPNGKSLARIADYFGIGVDDLMGTKKEPVEALDEVDAEVLAILRGMSVEEKLELLEYLKGNQK